MQTQTLTTLSSQALQAMFARVALANAKAEQVAQSSGKVVTEVYVTEEEEQVFTLQ